MKLGYWRLVVGKEKRPGKLDPDGVDKWEAKAEKAAGEIYLAVENDQRVHFRGCEEDPVEMWKLLETAHVQKKPGARFNAYDDLAASCSLTTTCTATSWYTHRTRHRLALSSLV